MRYIREWSLSDAPGIALALNNKAIQDNLRDGIPFPYTEQDARTYIASVLSAPPHSQYTWAIQNEGGCAVGSIGVFRKENIHSRTAEMGYYVAQPYWGQGIMTGAVNEACAYVFAHTDILRIFAEPFCHNAASRRVLEKSGFTLEGILCNNAVKGGIVIDMCMYALVREA